MKRLSRIKGYKDSQIKHFNEMYEKLREDVAEDEEENSNALVFYSQTELEEFRAYLVLADSDEKRRVAAMGNKRTLADFTSKEIVRFDHMQDVLTEFNRLVDDPQIDFESILPNYSDIEMAEHSQYREIWLGSQVKDDMNY
jgi:hypothetical protein